MSRHVRVSHLLMRSCTSSALSACPSTGLREKFWSDFVKSIREWSRFRSPNGRFL